MCSRERTEFFFSYFYRNDIIKLIRNCEMGITVDIYINGVELSPEINSYIRGQLI